MLTLVSPVFVNASNTTVTYTTHDSTSLGGSGYTLTSSGYRNGTIYGTPRWQTPNGIILDGNTTDYVKLPKIVQSEAFNLTMYLSMSSLSFPDTYIVPYASWESVFLIGLRADAILFQTYNGSTDNLFLWVTIPWNISQVFYINAFINSTYKYLSINGNPAWSIGESGSFAFLQPSYWVIGESSAYVGGAYPFNGTIYNLTVTNGDTTNYFFFDEHAGTSVKCYDGIAYNGGINVSYPTGELDLQLSGDATLYNTTNGVRFLGSGTAQSEYVNPSILDITSNNIVLSITFSSNSSSVTLLSKGKYSLFINGGLYEILLDTDIGIFTYTTGSYTLNTVKNFTVTYDGSYVTLYVNGTMIGSPQAFTANIEDSLAYPFRIGGSDWGIPSLNGSVYDCWISTYGYRLAEWKFDERNGNTIYGYNSVSNVNQISNIQVSKISSSINGSICVINNLNATYFENGTDAYFIQNPLCIRADSSLVNFNFNHYVWLNLIASSNGSLDRVTGWYLTLSNIAITAYAADGYILNAFFGSNSSVLSASNPYNLLVTLPLNITAIFMQVPNTIIQPPYYTGYIPVTPIEYIILLAVGFALIFKFKATVVYLICTALSIFSMVFGAQDWTVYLIGKIPTTNLIPIDATVKMMLISFSVLLLYVTLRKWADSSLSGNSKARSL